MNDLQDKLDVMPPQNTSSRILDPRDCSPLVEGELNSCRSSPTASSTSRERKIVRKGIERLEKQILQLVGVSISQDQVNIALLKKCKTVDVLAVNSAIENVQKALQKYVGFNEMDSEYLVNRKGKHSVDMKGKQIEDRKG